MGRDEFSRIEVLDDADLGCAADFTVEILGLRIESAPATDQIYGLIAKGSMDATTTANYWLAYRDDSGTKKLYGGFWAGGSARTVSVNLELVVGRWYYVAISFDDTTTKDLKLYTGLRVNDTRLASLTLQATANHAALSPSTNTAKLFIGCDMTAAGFQQNGSNVSFGGEIRINNQALAQSTLEARMNTRLQGLLSSLRGCWSLDEMTGTTTRDLVAGGRINAGGNDGTLVNGAQWCDDPQDVWYGKGWGTGAAPFALDPGVALIGFDSLSRRQGSSITASSTATGYPASRLRCPRKRLTHRTAAISTTYTWVVDFGSPMPVLIVCIPWHNFTSAALLKLQFHTADSWGAPALDLPVPPTLGQIVVVLRRQYGYRYMRLTALDAANPDGYLEIGGLDAFRAVELSQPMAAGRAGIQLRNESTMVTMQHFGHVDREIESRKDMTFSIPDLRRGQAEQLRAVLNEAAGGDPIVVAYDLRHALPRSVYGYVREPGSDSLESRTWTRQSVAGIAIEADA